MLVETESASSGSTRRSWWTGLGILALGVLLGAGFSSRFAPRSPGFATLERGPRSRAATPAPPPAPPTPAEARSSLPLFALELGAESQAVLEAVRERALERGLIIQSADDTVPATVVFDGQRLAAEVRIKGDWTDHVVTDKWSLRVRLSEGSVLGMRSFSVQAPFTRGYLWEWMVLETARREGVLAPRATFVEVAIDGEAKGIYFLEEHFAKEMLESQGRREGAIVAWDERSHWDMRLQGGAHTLPESTQRGMEFASAGPRAFGTRRLSSVDSLSRSLEGAMERMQLLQAASLSASRSVERLRALAALAEWEGHTLEQLIEPERTGRAHAVASLFQLKHGLSWINLRFYHDPIVDRLEPILFDNMAHRPGGREPVPWRVSGVVGEFHKSPAYLDALYAELGRMTRAGWLDELFRDLDPELLRFEAALQAEEPLADGFSVAAIKQRLRAQTDYLRRAVLPADPVNFLALYESAPGAEGTLSGVVEVEAWATTRAPVAVTGFAFENGVTLQAAPTLVRPSPGAHEDGGGGVVLSTEGVPARFRFPMDERLANLASIEAIKDELRRPPDLDEVLAIEVLTRPLAAEPAAPPERERLRFRRRAADWTLDHGRPDPPSLAEALARHPFLTPDLARSQLVVGAGEHPVAGDLILPEGWGLLAEAGAELRFDAGAVLLSEGPLSFLGVAARPVILGPKVEGEGWCGVVVLDAQARSEWANVRVEHTRAVERGSWVLTGGVTFFRSPLSMVDCTIGPSRAEDGLNVYGTDVVLERVLFRGCVSDSFDGDFVSARLSACRFLEGGSDGADFSGSRVFLTGCEFTDLGDKAISAGERTELEAEDCRVLRASIGVAAKDSSQVRIVRTRLYSLANYALAAYVKKPEYGPAFLEAGELDVQGTGLGLGLAQVGSTILVDGERLPEESIDVEALYEDGVLGR